MSASVVYPRHGSPNLIEHALKELYNYLESVQSEQFSSMCGDGTPGRNLGTSLSGEWGMLPSKEDDTLLLLDDNDSLIVPSVWGSNETNGYTQTLRHYWKLIKSQMKRFPTDKEHRLARSICRAMKRAIHDGDIAGNNAAIMELVRHSVLPLSEKVAQLLRSVQVVDLDQLTYLLERNNLAAQHMEGNDVILLCGSSGSGKTTTLHYLAGSTFQETDVNGFYHLRLQEVQDPALAHYETSNGRESMTRYLQTVELNYQGLPVVLCDTPSLSDSCGVEEDISNGLGMARAIQKAKSVRPVLVINRDGMAVRARFSGFSETLTAWMPLISSDGEVDFQPFDYIFTKYEDKHKTCIAKQFMGVWKQPNAETGKVAMVRSCVDRIIEKTTPEAMVISPLTGDPTETLHRLWRNPTPVLQPQSYFHKFVATASLEKLSMQLQITLGDLTSALLVEDYNAALYRLQQLKRLAAVLPEAREHAKLGHGSIVRHAEMLKENALEAIQEESYGVAIHKLQALLQFSRDIPESFKHTIEGLREAVHCVSQPRESMLSIIEEMRRVTDNNSFQNLLQNLRNNMEAVLSSEPLRVQVRTIQERMVGSEIEGHADYDKIQWMPLRSGEDCCLEQVESLVNLFIKDIPDLNLDWLKMNELVANRPVFLTSLSRLINICSILDDHPGWHNALQACRTTFELFFCAADELLSTQQLTCQSTEDFKRFEQQAWCLTLMTEVCEIMRDSLEGERANSILERAFNTFYSAVENILANAGEHFLTSEHDLEAFERQARFLALLRDVSDFVADSPFHERSAAAYRQAFNLFYAVVSSVLSEVEQNFESPTKNISALEKQAQFLALLKNVSSILNDGPGGERATVAYLQAFRHFTAVVDTLLGEIEHNFMTEYHDWETFESTCWFIALLVQGKWKYNPDPASQEEAKFKSLEQSLLKLMLKVELEISDTMETVQQNHIPGQNRPKAQQEAEQELITASQVMQGFNISELKIRRNLLQAIVQSPKLQKMLPSKLDIQPIAQTLRILDIQLVKLFAGQVLHVVTEYNRFTLLMQQSDENKKNNLVVVKKQAAVTLRTSIVMTKEDFTTIRDFSFELRDMTQANWRRLRALEKSVDMTIDKLDAQLCEERDRASFGCGVLETFPEGYWCR